MKTFLGKRKSQDGCWAKTYDFQDLDIGEHIYLEGDSSNIRSAASSWGTRYGIWLRVHKEGKRFKITRLSEAPVKRKKDFTPRAELKLDVLTTQKMHTDALRALTLLVLGCKNMLEELIDCAPIKQTTQYDPTENR